MNAYSVVLTDDAEQDIEEIGEYIARSKSMQRALHVTQAIRQAVESLSDFPERGTIVTELLEQGEPDYRQIRFKPYMIIYQVSAGAVVVQLIADGRRNMRTLLLRRLLQP